MREITKINVNVKNLTEALEALKSVEGESLEITGCSIQCTLDQAKLIRNNEDKENGKNRLSLKDWCKQENYNHKCIYAILRAPAPEGLGWIEYIEDSSANFKITAKGIADIYGDYEFTQYPVMTVINGSVYMDETHEYFNEVTDRIKEHQGFKDCGGYNEDLKGRKMFFSKNELELAKKAGIKLGTQRIKNENHTSI